MPVALQDVVALNMGWGGKKFARGGGGSQPLFQSPTPFTAPTSGSPKKKGLGGGRDVRPGVPPTHTPHNDPHDALVILRDFMGKEFFESSPSAALRGPISEPSSSQRTSLYKGSAV